LSVVAADCRVPTGQAKLEKSSGNLSGLGKVRGNIFFGKVRGKVKGVGNIRPSNL